ncbi:Hypothetical protein A7982_06983 [Minicystis rosea]|nr:Hypothetical protein A7982_06983 [Minicystis rosea]
MHHRHLALALVALASVAACKPLQGGSTSSNAGTGGSGGETDTGGPCKGTFGGAVSGTIACDPPSVSYDAGGNRTDVSFAGTATGAVEDYWSLAIAIPGHAQVKPYGQAGLTQLDSQIISTDAVIYGAHWDASAPGGAQGTVTLAFSSASDSAVHGQADIKYIDTSNATSKSIQLHLTF